MGKPTLSCSVCGAAMWKGRGSLTDGTQRCLTCRRGGAGAPVKPATRDCIDCGNAYPWRKERRCSPCRHERAKARRAANGPCLLAWCSTPQFCKELCSKHYWEQYKGLPFTDEVPCARCDKPLQYTRRSTQDATAFRFHNGCRPRAVRFVSRAERLKLYERDEYTCQICGSAVQEHGDAWNPWEASLDHIDPRAESSEPDHSMENLRTVHMICNTLRGPGDRSDDEVVTRLREWEVAARGR